MRLYPLAARASLAVEQRADIVADLDAFLAHTWAVTVTGAPKAWAMQFLEDNERTCRAWYGGSVGHLGFDGNLNTGLTLRTIRIVDGIAQVWILHRGLCCCS